MSYDYLPKYIFRNKYSTFLRKSGLYALLPTPAHTRQLDELQPGEKPLALPASLELLMLLYQNERVNFLRLFPSLHFLPWTFANEYFLKGGIMRCASDAEGQGPKQDRYTHQRALHKPIPG